MTWIKDDLLTIPLLEVLDMPEKKQGQGYYNPFEARFPDSAIIESEMWITSVSLYETTEEGKQYCQEEDMVMILRRKI